MKTYFCFISLIFMIAIKATSQDMDINAKGGDYAPDTAGFCHDQYNYPDYGGLDFKIQPCRREIIGTLKQNSSKKHKLDITKFTDPTLIPYHNLTLENKWQLKQLVSITKDQKYFNLLTKLALDSAERLPDRLEYIKLLEIYSPRCIEVLNQLLNDSIEELAANAACALVELGKYDKAFLFFKVYHSAEPAFEVYLSLAKMNTPEATKELIRLAKEDRQPGLVLSAVSSLSLHNGLCNVAFEVFSEFAKSKFEHIREKTVSCLAYYTGTPEAFNIIRQMKNDPSEVVRNEVNHVLSIYNKN